MTTRVPALALPRPLAILGFIAAYIVAFGLSEHAYGSLAVPSPFWLPDSVLLCALLLAPRRHWWIFVALIWPVRLAAGAVPGTPLWFQVAATANDAVKAVASAWLIQRIIGRRLRLDRLNELLTFFAIAAVAMPLLSAAAAAPARYALGDPVWDATYRWFLGDALTQVVVTPALFYWCTRGYRDVRQCLGEFAAMCGGLVCALAYAFVVPHPSPSLAVVYIPVPFLVWAAIRLRPFGTANAISLVAVVSMIGAARGTGAFADGSSVLSLQLFLLLLSVSLLSLAVVIAERGGLIENERAFNAQLLDAQERERTRIARELHDDLGQRLALLKLDIDMLARAVPRQSASIAAEAAKRTEDLAESVRSLSHRLHPATLRQIGLVPALEGLVAESAGRGPRVTFTHRGVPASMSQDVTIVLFRIAQEALQNAVKHSRAEHVLVHASGGFNSVMVSIEDNGVGFVVDPEVACGLGLRSMGERAQAAGGTLGILSSPHQGTRVDVTIPLTAKGEADAVAV